MLFISGLSSSFMLFIYPAVTNGCMLGQHNSVLLLHNKSEDIYFFAVFFNSSPSVSTPPAFFYKGGGGGGGGFLKSHREWGSRFVQMGGEG